MSKKTTKEPMVSIPLSLAKNAAFTLECIAHLQGREAELLPTSDAIRAAIKKATGK